MIQCTSLVSEEEYNRNLFYNHVGRKYTKRIRVDEVLIDSTVNTNRQKIELFYVILSCMEVGIPIAYLLLDSGTGSGLNKREKSLTFVFKHIRKQFHRLRPKVFHGQTKSKDQRYTKSFDISPSICLWHMKREIKRKISQDRTKKQFWLEKKDENELLSITDTYYFQSSVCIDVTDNHLQTLAVQEMGKLLS